MPPKSKQGIGPSPKVVDDEVTKLSSDEESRYKKWTHHYKLRDIDPKTDEPYDDVKYDMRGYWKGNQVPKMGRTSLWPPQFEGAHGPDTYKQHGHPTFSQESKYSKGHWDGGMWIPGTESLLKQPKMAVSHASKKR